MGLLSSLLNLSTYVEVSKTQMDASEMSQIKSASITDRTGDFGDWRTLDIQTKTGASLSGVVSPKCNHASGTLDLSKCKIFLTLVKKTGAPDSEAIKRWVVE